MGLYDEPVLLTVPIASSSTLALRPLSNPPAGSSYPKALALHGYTGESLDFQSFLSQEKHLGLDWYGLDLLGHGKSSSPDNPCLYTEESYMEHLDAVVHTLAGDQAITLLAYSFGGRLALNYAVKRPKAIKRLILISATPGMEEEERRMRRKIADAAIIDKLKSLSLQDFVDYWYQTPIIRSQQNSPLFAEIYARRLKHTSSLGLIHSLSAFGQGVAPSSWSALHTLSFPVLWIVGAEDGPYIEIAQKACRLLPKAELKIIAKVGHAPHLEDELATLKAIAECSLWSG